MDKMINSGVFCIAMKKPWKQGSFDGLCGAYSVVNAVHYLYEDFSQEDCAALFTYMVRSHPELFSQALLSGMRFKQLWGLANTAKKCIAPYRTMRLYRPFYNQKVSSVDDFMDRVSTMIGTNAVMLVGLGRPWNHWSVASKITPKTITFQDSGSCNVQRVYKSSLSLEDSDGHIMLDYHQSIVIERL
jgi:hypothetical protein